MGLRYTAMPTGGGSPPGYGQMVRVTRGEMKQPNYSRGAANWQTSDRLREFQQCVANDVSGTSPGNRRQARDNFRNAAKGCAS